MKQTNSLVVLVLLAGSVTPGCMPYHPNPTRVTTGPVPTFRHPDAPLCNPKEVVERAIKARGGDALLKRLSSLGIRVLRNEVHTIDGLQLIGVDDRWSPNYDAFKALKLVNKAQAALALCHNPDAQDLDEWKGYQGWVLAGHTHGGQCKPPFLPPPLLPVMNRRYTSGSFDLGNGRQLYINRGLGYLMRVRFNARPEMTLFHLTKST